jgi:hypothetical protein
MRRSRFVVGSLCLVVATTLASAARGQTCTAYAPDTGSFYTDLPFTAVSTTARTVGQYTIRLSGSSIVVTDGGATNAVVPLGASTAAYAAFYPSSGANANRFLFIDKRAYVGSFVDYTPVMVDLRAWQPGQPAQDGNVLPYQSYSSSSYPQLHVNPSPGNGLAVLVWYGTNQILAGAQGTTIRRSDSAAVLCTVPSFDPAVSVVGEATSTAVLIKDGGATKLECALPRGSLDITPNSRWYGTILANATSTQSFTFKNTGTDCLNVTAIASSAHCAPNGFAPFGLAAGASSSVNVTFNPAGAIGTFNETITVTRSPAAGESSIAVSGTSTVTVSVSSSSATVLIGGTQQFQATVAGSSNTAVTWSVTEGAAGGTVTSGGLYTAPAVAGTYHVVATSVAYPTLHTTVTVTVPAVQVVVSPTTATLNSGQTKQFTAAVTIASNTSVTWMVQEGSVGGSVNTAGLYTAGGTSGTYHVVATSVADTDKSDSATVTVTAPPIISNTKVQSVTADQATISWTTDRSSDSQVSWGTTTSYGSDAANSALVTAHSLVLTGLKGGTTYHYKVSSADAAGRTYSVDYAFTTPVLSVSLTPAAAEVLTSESLQFNAVVSNASNAGVSWSVLEFATGGGTVTAGGLYTAPRHSGTFHVVATSVADSSKTATATVTVKLRPFVNGGFEEGLTAWSGAGSVSIVPCGVLDSPCTSAESTAFAELGGDGNLGYLEQMFDIPTDAGGIYFAYQCSNVQPEETWNLSIVLRDEVTARIVSAPLVCGESWPPMGPFRSTSLDLSGMSGHLATLMITSDDPDGLRVDDFVLGPVPTTLPVITAVTYPPDGDAIVGMANTVTWKTDVLSDSVLEWGTTQQLGSAKTVATLTADHSVSFPSMNPGLYYFRVKSRHASGGEAVSALYSMRVYANTCEGRLMRPEPGISCEDWCDEMSDGLLGTQGSYCCCIW